MAVRKILASGVSKYLHGTEIEWERSDAAWVKFAMAFRMAEDAANQTYAEGLN